MTIRIKPIQDRSECLLCLFVIWVWGVCQSINQSDTRYPDVYF